MSEYHFYQLLSALIFCIGAAGFILRRNALVQFMCVELMLNAANLSLIACSRQLPSLDGQVFVFFVMAVAAAEAAVGLAIIINLFVGSPVNRIVYDGHVAMSDE